MHPGMRAKGNVNATLLGLLRVAHTDLCACKRLRVWRGLSAQLLGDLVASAKFGAAAEARRAAMQELMYDEERGAPGTDARPWRSACLRPSNCARILLLLNTG